MYTLPPNYFTPLSFKIPNLRGQFWIERFQKKTDFHPAYTGKKGEGEREREREGEGRIFVAVERGQRRERKRRWKRRYVFANVGAVLEPPTPYEIISSLLERRCAETAAACWENSSATARIIRKINYFPSLLINFTIASMFPFPALLSRPPSLGRKGGERKRVAKGVVGRRRMEKERATKKERRGSFERLPLPACPSYPRFWIFLPV